MPVIETVEDVAARPAVGVAFKVDPGEGRVAEPLRIFGAELTVKISSRDSGGAFAVVEGVTPPLSGPPMHIHLEQDEWWHVVEGNFKFVVDEQEILAGPGSVVYAPRGSRHTFQNIGEEPGITLATTVPGGFDLFFEEIAAAAVPGARPDPAKLAPIFERHRMVLAGPPLGAR
jgi:mannose-6-phosphate isomerase-like protein (cupin superfamily)